MSRVLHMLIAALCLGLAACLSTSPERAAEEALGGEILGLGHGPLHRPGQPCLVCHGEQSTGFRNTFELAGTVFERPKDKVGVGGVEVVLTDGNGDDFTVKTNRTGNFFVSLDTSVSSPRRGRSGELIIPKEFSFPLHVEVRNGSTVQKMQGLVWRNSSCADCHRGPADDLSNGPVYLEAP